MKKIICIIIVLCILFSCGCAEIDLAGMGYNELVELKRKVELAIWNSKEWQEVTVPRGVYQVGVDIPAGHWTVKVAKGQRWAYVSWGDKLNEEKEGISFGGKRASVNNLIGNPNHKYYESDGGQAEYSFEVYDGEYIIITFADVVFTPYAGQPDLGFK